MNTATANMIYFDTLRFVKTLKAAGTPPAQAEALAEAQQEALSECMTTSFATKTDILGVSTEITEVKAVLQAEIANVKAEIAEVKAELKAEIVEVKAEITNIKSDIKVLISRVNRLDWIMGLILTGMASLVVKAFFLT